MSMLTQCCVNFSQFNNFRPWKRSINLMCLDVIYHHQNLIKVMCFGLTLLKVKFYVRVTPDIMENIIFLTKIVCKMGNGVCTVKAYNMYL